MKAIVLESRSASRTAGPGLPDQALRDEPGCGRDVSEEAVHLFVDVDVRHLG
jgi:hypothetical protein